MGKSSDHVRIDSRLLGCGHHIMPIPDLNLPLGQELSDRGPHSLGEGVKLTVQLVIGFENSLGPFLLVWWQRPQATDFDLPVRVPRQVQIKSVKKMEGVKGGVH